MVKEANRHAGGLVTLLNESQDSIPGTLAPEENVQALVGKTLGQYKIDSFEDATNKKWIYSGRHPELPINTCIKVLRPDVDEETLKSFLEEKDNLTNLNHDNAERIFDAGEQEGHHYIITEWVKGKNLKARLDAGERFSLEEIIEIADTVLGVLDYAYRKGCPHTDVKLENIVIEDDDRPLSERIRVIDFGPWYSDHELRNHISGTAHVLEYLLENRADPNTKIPDRLNKIIEKAKRDGGYKTPGEFKKVFESYLWWRGETISLKKVGIQLSRRKFLQAASLTGAVTGVGAGLGILAKEYTDYRDSVAYTIKQLRGTDPSNLAVFDSRFKELRSRIFYEITIPWDETIPRGEFIFGTDEGRWYSSPSIKPDNGFLAGIYWEAFGQTQDEIFWHLAKKRTEDIQITLHDSQFVNAVRFFYSHAKAHDVLSSMGIEDTIHRELALQALDILANKYDPRAQFVPISDSSQMHCEAGMMMGVIPFFRWGYKTTRDKRYLEIANAHTGTAIKVGIREDGSVRKTAIFEMHNGEQRVVSERNSKGISGDSTLSRAQAQMLYGLVNSAAQTRDPSFLEASKRVADCFINQASRFGDYIVLYDFNAIPQSGAPKDTTANSIGVKGLLPLSNLTISNNYGNVARTIERFLAIYYLSTNPQYQGILREGCHNFPQGEYVNSSLASGDYHFLAT